jgi:hypothetical protein
MYNVDDPKFFQLLDQCEIANTDLIKAEKEATIWKFWKKLPSYVSMISGLIQLYLLPAIETNYLWTHEKI